MKRHFLFAACLALLGIATSCEEDPEYVHIVTYVDIVTFEDAAVNPDTAYFDNRSYVYQDFLRFVNNHPSWGSYWGISTKTDTVTPGYTNDPSIFGTGGASGSRTFAYGYHSHDSGVPISMTLVDANAARVAAFTPRRVQVALTTYVALALRDGNDGNDGTGGAFGNVKLGKGGWFSATFVGYNGEVKTDSVVCYPGDWRGESLRLMTQWTPVDLSRLGEVTRVDVKIDGSEELYGDYGFNAPAYVAIDNFEFVRHTRSDN